MKSRLLGALFVLASLASAQEWQIASPGYHYQFPRDHLSHPGYQTEWWYYTGNLRGANGHRYGFELTFFREGVHLPRQAADSETVSWRPDEIYLAHLAFSDIDGGQFYHAERLHRAGPGLAGAGDGASAAQARYWNGNWQVQWSPGETGEQTLAAVTDLLELQLTLRPQKPLVIHGENGVSLKGALSGEASHYISFTRLAVSGSVKWKNTKEAVTGQAWMDHEFFTEPRDNTLAGWDWFAIQLDNNEELMLYRLRTTSGGESPYSSGTFVDVKGAAHFLRDSDFSLTPGETWKTIQSKDVYPVAWAVTVPSLALELKQQTTLQNQELFSGSEITPSYWEGAVTYNGHIHSQPVKGVGYLEMTGYNKQLRLAGQ